MMWDDVGCCEVQLLVDSSGSEGRWIDVGMDGSSWVMVRAVNVSLCRRSYCQRKRGGGEGWDGIGLDWIEGVFKRRRYSTPLIG